MASLRRSALVLLGLLIPFTAAADGVNAVIGDDSYVARFGAAPDGDGDADEDLRLRVHLEHVEGLLRGADTRGLSADQQAARAHNLDLLHAYHARGVFPRNHTVAGRRPHFIDETGRICAVGYLVEQTAGRALAEAVNAAYEWAFVPEIRDPRFQAWATGSGLTLTELAMIQPSYDGPGFGRPLEPRPRPWRPPPPPPPPVDEAPVRVARVNAALQALDGAVQDCANRIGVAESVTEIKASVTLMRRAVRIDVTDVGNATFRQCVKRLVTVRTAASFFTRRTQPVTVTHVFAVAGGGRGMAFDREATGRLVRQQVRELAHCIDPAAAGRDFVDATVAITVDPTGEFRAVKVTRPRLSAAAGTCVLAVIGRHAPPPFAGPQMVLTLDLNGI